jgi:hypothetical protein
MEPKSSIHCSVDFKSQRPIGSCRTWRSCIEREDRQLNFHVCHCQNIQFVRVIILVE